MVEIEISLFCVIGMGFGGGEEREGGEGGVVCEFLRKVLGVGRFFVWQIHYIT